MRIYSLVLAAGESQRFGSPKLLSQLDGKSLLERALATAQSACPGKVCVVLGHHASNVLDSAATQPDLVAENTDYRNGIGSSIACGVRACRSSADALVVMLADQPTITPNHVQALIDAWSGDTDEIVLSTHAGVQAPPTLFGSGAFGELASLTGDQGARSVILSDRYTKKTVTFNEPAIDVDTEDDLALLQP